MNLLILHYLMPNPGGLDPNKFDIDDFKIKDVEVKFSPRIGIGFPVTEATVFHAHVWNVFPNA
ncbi:MAG: hypothetical protein MZV64_41395 [Ignavibacteriales bacterium]|nr:hypothetical protein [Ignavibacteriales bacterium]